MTAMIAVSILSVPFRWWTAALRRSASLKGHAPRLQRLSQQYLYLGIGAAQFGRSQPLDRGIDCRIETEGEGFLLHEPVQPGLLV